MDPTAQWVFFDVDQTLCDFEAMMGRALRRSIGGIERRWPTLTGRFRSRDLEDIRNRLAAAYTDGPVPLIAVRRQMFAVALADVATETDIDEITEDYLHHRFADPVIFPDVVPALRELTAAGIRLGVITNGNSKLDALGLADYFSAEFVAEQVGFAKPDRRIYQHAADALGVAAHGLLMVGDSLPDDVHAARAAGWRAVWLDRSNARKADEAERIGDLSRLGDFVGTRPAVDP
jgi:putative hydrolase of the HAD superfamily